MYLSLASTGNIANRSATLIGRLGREIVRYRFDWAFSRFGVNKVFTVLYDGQTEQNVPLKPCF